MQQHQHQQPHGTFSVIGDDLEAKKTEIIESPVEQDENNHRIRDSELSEERLKCGWFWLRPKSLQRFRTAKWALFWLCWAGAMQGNYYYYYHFQVETILKAHSEINILLSE